MLWSFWCQRVHTSLVHDRIRSDPKSGRSCDGSRLVRPNLLPMHAQHNTYRRLASSAEEAKLSEEQAQEMKNRALMACPDELLSRIDSAFAAPGQSLYAASRNISSADKALCLEIACLTGDARRAEQALQLGANVDRSALFDAVYRGHVDLVQVLIDYKASTKEVMQLGLGDDGISSVQPLQ